MLQDSFARGERSRKIATRVSKRNAEIVLKLVAEWMGQHGCAESFKCPEGRELDQYISHADDDSPCSNAIASPAPTGEDAAYRGLGPMLRMDWDWSGTPTPAIILEGGPDDWAIRCSFWVQDRLNERKIPVFVEPYLSFVLCAYPR
jgi:hypothetical protein